MEGDHAETRPVPSLDDLTARIAVAAERLRDHVRRTPVDALEYLGDGATVYGKLENLQHTGSFKLRGAFNKLIDLSQHEGPRACVTASTGNHGMAVAWAGRALEFDVTVFVPGDTAPTKLDGIRRLGGTIHMEGEDCLESEVAARIWGEKQGIEYVSPYNDIDVIAGQGTVGVEMADDMAPADVVCVAVGGGGLMSGTAAWLRRAWPDVHIVGCLPAASPAMAESVAAGRIVESRCDPTLSDGTAGGIEAGAITFDFCSMLVDEFVLVDETDIRSALRAFITGHHMLGEGAAGVALAVAADIADRSPDARVAAVVCGANIGPEALSGVLAG